MKVVAIVGTYRKGGIIDSIVDEVLDSAKKAGADVEKIYLIDKQIEFCTNCRLCTQKEGIEIGECPINDGMNSIIAKIIGADAIVLASPMNCYTVTAVMKRFVERLLCFAYWPWGMYVPKFRIHTKNKRALIVASSAAPALYARYMTGMVSLLKGTAAFLGAKVTGVIFIGLCARDKNQKISEKTRQKARYMGRKLLI